ncbi:MAG TPA: DMT family transporter [Thermotogota bacterium]|nr:DMT family transporter [Thermotogota bacterium]
MIYHIFLWSTIVFWGLSFVATSVIIDTLPPVMTAMIRFLIAWFVLIIITKGHKPYGSLKHRLLCGLWGITLYFVFENFALRYTSPTNVALIISTIPMFNLIYLKMFSSINISKKNVAGSLTAFLGVGVVIVGDQFRLEVNPLGDLLTIFAVIAWIMYTHYLIEIEKKNNDHSQKNDFFRTLSVTKSITFWGFIFLIPPSAVEFFSFKGDILLPFQSPQIIISLLYLGIFCSSLAYYFWNESLKHLGPRKTTNSLFTIPIVTAFAQGIFLKDVPHLTTIIGGTLVIAGLFYSENKSESKHDHL